MPSLGPLDIQNRQTSEITPCTQRVLRQHRNAQTTQRDLLDRIVATELHPYVDFKFAALKQFSATLRVPEQRESTDTPFELLDLHGDGRLGEKQLLRCVAARGNLKFLPVFRSHYAYR